MKAIVFIDVQNDFIAGALRNEKAIEVTPKIVEFAKECVKNGYKLYATRDTHEKTTFPTYEEACKRLTFYGNAPEDDLIDAACHTPNTGYFTTLEGKNLPVEHCIEGTDGWMIDERLWNVIEGHVTVVNKPTFGSYDLAEIIDEDNGKYKFEKDGESNFIGKKTPEFDEIILVGFCTSICVASNAILLRAKFPNTKISVRADMCACVTEESHNAALKVLEMQQIDIVDGGSEK